MVEIIDKKDVRPGKSGVKSENRMSLSEKKAVAESVVPTDASKQVHTDVPIRDPVPIDDIAHGVKQDIDVSVKKIAPDLHIQTTAPISPISPIPGGAGGDRSEITPIDIIMADIGSTNVADTSFPVETPKEFQEFPLTLNECKAALMTVYTLPCLYYNMDLDIPDSVLNARSNQLFAVLNRYGFQAKYMDVTFLMIGIGGDMFTIFAHGRQQKEEKKMEAEQKERERLIKQMEMERKIAEMEKK